MELSAAEARVLGCLIEKAATVPDTYPLTLSSLRTACTQSSNRDPVVAYDESEIEAAADQLRERGLVRRVYPSHGGRTVRYRHVADEVLIADPRALALMAVLLLRGPQTLGELRSRTDRYVTFADLGEVQQVLDLLAGREPPLVAAVPRQRGQKEGRFTQLLCGAPDAMPTTPAAAAATSTPAAPRVSDDGLAGRLARLEADVAGLRDAVQRLRATIEDRSPPR